jgi:hypothetical protein
LNVLWLKKGGKMLRKLIYIPIIHTEDDMGSMAEFVKKEYKKKYSSQQWDQHKKTVTNIWEIIRINVMQLDLDWHKVRIYQDGLPVCGKELNIVQTLAEKGSLNHKLIMELQQKGAMIEGTEKPELLLAEYNSIMMIVQAKNREEKDMLTEKYSKESNDLLSKRDHFISERIDETLEKGETGILFLGLMHQANKLIEKKFDVKYMAL